MALTEVDVARLNDDVFAATGPNKNRIINGDMRIDQRNAGASVTPGGSFTYSVDRFGGARPSSGVSFNLQQVSDAPAGFVNSLKATVPTGATPTGTQLSLVGHLIEGLNISDFEWGSANAQTVTLSFWVKSSVTGLFPLAVVNSGTIRAYGATYVINTANTWEKKTIVIAGDTTGTWLTTNGIGLQINWGLGGTGASRTITTGWQDAPSPGSSVGVIAGTVNLVETTGATWQITGVQLEVGDTATPFEHRNYGQELALCQRYFLKIQHTLTHDAGSNGQIFYGSYTFPVQMRANPSATTVYDSSNNIDTAQVYTNMYSGQSWRSGIRQTAAGSTATITNTFSAEL